MSNTRRREYKYDWHMYAAPVSTPAVYEQA
jgi:hypothetical protein